MVNGAWSFKGSMRFCGGFLFFKEKYHVRASEDGEKEVLARTIRF